MLSILDLIELKLQNLVVFRKARPSNEMRVYTLTNLCYKKSDVTVGIAVEALLQVEKVAHPMISE